MSKSKEYEAQLYDAAVLTVGAVGVSFVRKQKTHKRHVGCSNDA